MTPETPRQDQVADPALTYLVTSALQGAVDHGTARRLGDDAFEMPDGLESGYGPSSWMEPCGREEVFLEGTAPGDGSDCLHFELPDWGDEEEMQDAVEVLRRAAGRALKEALRERLAASADLR